MDTQRFRFALTTLGLHKKNILTRSNCCVAGKVIGKKGVVISNIQREARVKLINACPPIGKSLWVAIVILGSDVKCILKAYRAISEIVSDGMHFCYIFI